MPAVVDRPRKDRRGARVVVRCHQQVLLMADSDPGLPGSGWWVTPGGGIDAGEASRTAAARELFEETGFLVAEGRLQGPAGRRIVTHGYSDRILVQEEDFWLLDVEEPFTVNTVGFTDGEKDRMGGWGWFGHHEIPTMEVWPARILELVEWDGGGSLDLGSVEESTVPVTP